MIRLYLGVASGTLALTSTERWLILAWLAFVVFVTLAAWIIEGKDDEEK